MELMVMDRRAFFGTTSKAAVGAAVVGASLELGGCSASWVTTALNDLPTVLSIAESIIQIVGAAQGSADPNAMAIASKAAAEIQTDLTLVQTLVQGYNGSNSSSQTTALQKIDAALLDVQTNLGAVEGALHIANPGVQAAISAGVSAALVIITGLEAVIPAPATPSPSPTPVSSVGAIANHHIRHASLHAAAKANNESQVIKAAYNSALAAAGATQFAVK